MQQKAKDLIAGYVELIESRIQSGWEAYLMTMMFKPMSGSKTTVAMKMELEAQRVYATLLPWVERNPTAPSRIAFLPIFIGCPDFPVFKHEKISFRDATLNDGRHLHGIQLIAPTSRLKMPLNEMIAKNYCHYVRAPYSLDRLDVVPISHDAGYVVGYGMKALGSRRAFADDLIVLPRSHSEVKG